MPIVPLILAIAVAGFLVWIITQVPMPAVFRNVVYGFVCFALVLWILQMFGIDTGIGRVRLR